LKNTEYRHGFIDFVMHFSEQKMQKKSNALKKRKFELSVALALAFGTNALSATAQQAQASQTVQPATTEQIMQMYSAGDYRAVAKLGSERLRLEPNNTDLRISVANSYAWTGQSPQAIENYKALQGTDKENRANLGLANVYRWNGLPGLSVPLYRQVLAAEPGNKDADEGLAYAMRQLRPQTQARILYSNDSQDTERQALAIAQRWTDPSMQHVFELEASALRDERNELRVNQRDLTLGYAGVANELKPRLEITAQQKPRNSLFASGEVQLPHTPITITAGRVNWGKMAFDPNALAANLTANHFGARVGMPTEIGILRMGYQAYRVSDDNLIQGATAQFIPAWQPLNIQQVKIFAGFEGRKARFNSPLYWSPERGNYVGTIGFSGEWLDRSWERTILVQYGVPLGGEAENSYSANAGIKHWVNESLAIGFSLSAQKAQRTGAYRSNTAIFSVQGLW
jgi:tetratricopeptide (TPR) repeat protein